MKSVVSLFLFMSLTLSAAAESAAPHVLVRALQELQTQIVAGRASAREDQPRMLADIANHFSSAPADVWREPRHARAAIIWLLSGGSSRGMRSILRHGNFPDLEAQLARGALAYAEGRIQQAIEILVPVEPRSLDPALGGQIALVQAALVLSQDRQRAIESLALARLLAPGTLVEETALRRQISLVGQTQDVEAFAYLSRQYARRFKSSLYAEEFRESFTQTFMRIGIAAPEDQLIKLKPILDSFEPDERCRLAILISRASLLSGAWRSAESFADTIMRLPIDPSCDVPRARFYRAAARALIPKNDADLTALDRFDPDRLIPEDRALRRASLAYARIVRSFPDSVEPDTETKASLPAAQTLADAMVALAEADRLLQEKRK